MNSAEHAEIIRSTAFNYFGVGLGVTAGGDRYWTALFLRGPDRTAPWAKMLAPTRRLLHHARVGAEAAG